MRFKTHLVFGILLYLIFDLYLDFDKKIIYFVLILFFSILPDLDLHTSYIGKRLKGLSHFFEIVLGHRELLHSIWIALFLYLFLDQWGYGIAVVGYIGHLGLDIITKKGVKLFWPYVKMKGYAVTGKFTDNMLFFLFLGADLFAVLYLQLL
jgi:inner membrane protein